MYMTIEAFEASLREHLPPPSLPALAQALWWETKGDWDRAHTVAQDVDDAQGAWVHAYLHRREGDPGNAAYWYRRAGRSPSREPLDRERTAILTALFGGGA